MKHIYVIIGSGLLLLMASCAKDKTNFDLKPKEQITVTGLESSYTTISQKDHLNIDPTVTSTEPDANFDYLWGIYETNVQGSAPVLDTIGRTKKLDYLVKQPSKGWVLVFRVTNKKTKYAQYFTSAINVVTQFTRGWYVAKDDGSLADMDLFLTPVSLVPDSKVENVYSLVNGGKLNGKAQLLTYFSSYKSTVTGVLSNTKALFLTTDKDISAMNMSTLKQIRNINTLFYQSPATAAPDAVLLGSSANYLVNDGQCYSIYAMSANSGQFGVRKMKDDANTPYHLSRYFLTSTSTDPYFFDDMSSSFLMGTATGAVMTAVTDDAVTAMPAQNNNKKMIYMGFKTTTYVASEFASYVNGYAIFQDKANPSLKILSQLNPNKTKMSMVNDTLKTTDKIFNATNYALLDGDENLIYFATGNQVWSRNLSNKFDQLQFSAPAGEEITFIRHKKYTETGYTHNYILIGTKSGDSYKVRMFTKSSGSLASSPDITLEGKGIVRDVMYMSPSVSEYTYSNSY